MLNSDYSAFIGLEYEEPNGCFTLIDHIYREAYGIDLGRLDEGLTQVDSHARTARIREHLARLAIEVSDPREGDVVILRGRPWHLGLIVRPGEMLHSYRGGSACIERYDSIRWRGKVCGFYRYQP